MKEKGLIRKYIKEVITSSFKTRKKEREERKKLFEAKIQREVALFSRQAHEQVIAELKQEREDQERATGEGMPEYD